MHSPAPPGISVIRPYSSVCTLPQSSSAIRHLYCGLDQSFTQNLRFGRVRTDTGCAQKQKGAGTATSIEPSRRFPSRPRLSTVQSRVSTRCPTKRKRRLKKNIVQNFLTCEGSGSCAKAAWIDDGRVSVSDKRPGSAGIEMKIADISIHGNQRAPVPFTSPGLLSMGGGQLPAAYQGERPHASTA